MLLLSQPIYYIYNNNFPLSLMLRLGGEFTIYIEFDK